jgi:hypothetical protein
LEIDTVDTGDDGGSVDRRLENWWIELWGTLKRLLVHPLEELTSTA